MKRHILVLYCALLLSGLEPRMASAQAPEGAGTDGKSHKIKVHHHWWHWPKRERKVNTPPLYTVPKSTGWWHHHGPGPAGAGVK